MEPPDQTKAVIFELTPRARGLHPGCPEEPHLSPRPPKP